MQNLNANFKSDFKTRCSRFSISIIQLCDTLPQKRSAWVITDQLIRASTSIGANITEARASSSRLEFKKFFEIALKSSNEAIYWMELLRDAKLINVTSVNELMRECEEISKIIGKAVITLKSK